MKEPDLGWYVSSNYTHLMTDVERRACKTLMMEAKAQGADSAEMVRVLRKLSPGNDFDVRDALKDGPAEFWRRVADRLLHEHPAEFVLARCRRCSSLLRTPKAKLCVACGLDWH